MGQRHTEAVRAGAQCSPSNPYAGLILSGGTLYGPAVFGGVFGFGTLFAVNTVETGFTNLHSFTGGSGGAGPSGELILSANTLFGTADTGGNAGSGTVFGINTGGSGFTNLYSFTARFGASLTNRDGSGPAAGLVLSGSTLYGTASSGGSYGNGTVFKVNRVGASPSHRPLADLHSTVRLTATAGKNAEWSPAPST
jgi:uncharacterized repeat protein (TIGR03803 family)